MALSFTRNSVSVDDSAGGVSTITSGSLSLATNDVIVAVFSADGNLLYGTLSISNSGAALPWVQVAVTDTNTNSKVGVWWARVPDAASRTVSVTTSTATPTTGTRTLDCLVHTGAHRVNAVPGGRVFSGTGGTNVSQTITPTATGSMLWLAAADNNATNSFAAGTDCTLETNFHDATRMSAVLVRPTTQPRGDALAFTLAETDTAGKVAWVAFEVQADDGDRPYTAETKANVLAGEDGNTEFLSLLNPRGWVDIDTAKWFAAELTTAAGGGGVSGTLATTNANDTLSAAGTQTQVGTLSTTNAADTLAASGTQTQVGTLARTNANDTVSAAGTQTQVGTLARTNANDTLAASGTQTQVGTVAYTNANDTLAAEGSAGAVTGTLATTNADDTAAAAGTSAGAASLGGGGARKKVRKPIIWVGDRLAKILGEEEEEADAGLQEAAKTIEKAIEKATDAPISITAPRFDEVREVAVAHGQEQAVLSMFEQHDYVRMLALYRMLQEEDDIETLLLLV